jgi:hypothetical protein
MTFPLITVAGIYLIAGVIIFLAIMLGPVERKFKAYCAKHGVGQ